MITLTVIYKMKQGADAHELHRALTDAGIHTKSQAEPGNICYDYYMPADGSNGLILLEMWENDMVLDAHHLAPHFLAAGPIKEQYVESTAICRSEN